MCVKNEHKQYVRMLDKWQRCMDVCEGQDAVHGAGERYLPKLSNQETKEYASYKSRANFYNATWRTVAGLVGMIFRKSPIIKVPELVEKMLPNIDLAGTDIKLLALRIAQEALKVGRVGVFVDFPKVDTNKATMADTKNYRPSMKIYSAMSIINWKTRSIDNAHKLSMVVLRECVDKAKDEFTDEEQIQYRVLDLENVDNKHVYRVRVFEVRTNEKGEEEDVLIEGPSYPLINGEFLEDIPFQFIGVDSTLSEVDDPPLIDLVDLNLSHYRVTADYEHGCHFTGLPTPIVSGFTPDDDDGSKVTFNIGSTTAWVFRRENAKAYFLEFTGAGLSCLKENLERKEALMAVIGARMLEAQAKNVESANTASIHRGGEQSMLASIADSISIGLTKLLEVFCKFAGATGEANIRLNKDFFPIPMDALTLTAIIAGWQNGAYSYETMFENLKKGEIVLQEQTPEDEQEAIKANPPPVMGAGEGAPTNPGDVEKKSPKAAATPATPAPTQKQLQNKGGQN